MKESSDFTICFLDLCWSSVSDKKWTELDAAQHRAHAMRLLDGLEVIARDKRLKVARAILYMAQGKYTSSFCWFHKRQHWSGRRSFPHVLQSGATFLSLGTFAECSSEAEVQHWMRYNIFLLLDVGTFSALVELLNMEIEYVHQLSCSIPALQKPFLCGKSNVSHCVFFQ